MATDQLTLNVTCPACGALLPMRTSTQHTGKGSAEIAFDTSTVRNHLAQHNPPAATETPAPRPGQQIISDPSTWPTISSNKQRLTELLTWLRANDIEPNDIPTTSTVSIESTNPRGGQLIRHTAYLRNSAGRHYTEPDADTAAQEERTVLLTVPLPDSWPQPVAPIEPGTALAETEPAP